MYKNQIKNKKNRQVNAQKMKTQILNTVELMKAEKLNQLIENGLNSHDLQSWIQSIQRWRENPNDSDSPINFLSEDLYKNLLYYILLNAIDRYIENAQPFIPEQNYRQEVDRLFKPSINCVPFTFCVDEVGQFGISNVAYFLGIQSLMGITEPSKDDYKPKFDYKVAHQSLYNRLSMFDAFQDNCVKSLMGEVVFDNFQVYKRIYQLDVIKHNNQPFEPKQNYSQESSRQIKFLEGLDEQLMGDEVFKELYYTIDCALQDIYFQSMPDSSPENKTPQITKLW
jgi:hypothetical protein